MIEDKVITDRTPAELDRKCEFWLEHRSVTGRSAEGYCRLVSRFHVCMEDNQLNRMDCPVMKAYMNGLEHRK
jgi:primosomal replication protein N